MGGKDNFLAIRNYLELSLMTKYVNQLLILARIRNFHLIVEQKLNDMPISYDVENDGLYLRGIE